MCGQPLGADSTDRPAPVRLFAGACMHVLIAPRSLRHHSRGTADRRHLTHTQRADGRGVGES